MAKKRKGARPARKAKPARSVRKKTTSKAAAPKRQAVDEGLVVPGEVDFSPLKKTLRAHIDRLSAAKNPEKVERALRILRQAESDLRDECSPTMVIPTS